MNSGIIDYNSVIMIIKKIELYKDKESNKYVWKCPNCGNTDQRKMNVVRRTCGYLGENFWNEGRTDEIHDRVLHL